ncbi:MAG: Trehalose-6-phosphate hydrolase [Candidatus Celerinatantimonas neptuna]|nr:MAG: Trehalose-6-phosphate hydrolase [Candidatus Celerinatantimonas neptuna]
MCNNEIPWWQDGVIYQIYPKSFQDTTGSGQGDLQGVIKRLNYLQELEVSAIWLTPIYPSPQVDNGYDVSDYQSIDPSYGTLDDFDELVTNVHQRGIRIVMDMVFNHTSIEHPWFKQASESRDNPYRSYYIWHDGDIHSPPNNWCSKFGGNAWQWHEATQQYYLHLFAPQQADLNWENNQVRESLRAICRFWAERGIDGLRLDVVNLVSKQPGFEDDGQGDGRRFYTDGPRIHEFLQEMNRDAFNPLQLMTVGEMSSTTLEHCQRYSSLEGHELSMTFNFHHLKVDYAQGEKWTIAEPDFVALKAIFQHWQQGMYQQAWNALFWCNHDQPRVVSRFGDDGIYRIQSAKTLAMLLHGMQGTPFIYQGEEIGMSNPGFTQIEQYRDIESLNMYDELASCHSQAHRLAVLACKSRDNSRTPMPWDDTLNGGFTDGHPWIELAKNNSSVNVKAALADPDSVFYCYRQLIRLRRSLLLMTYGDYHDLLPEHPFLWIYVRQWQGQQLLVMANLKAQCIPVPLPDTIVDCHWQLLLNNGLPEDTCVCDEMVLPAFSAAYWFCE